LLVLTDWEEFAHLDLNLIRGKLKYPIVVDGRNLYAPQAMANAGLIYHSVGRTPVRLERLAEAAVGRAS
jgi:UDPglucose 6-dehydrogenase